MGSSYVALVERAGSEEGEILYSGSGAFVCLFMLYSAELATKQSHCQETLLLAQLALIISATTKNSSITIPRLYITRWQSFRLETFKLQNSSKPDSPTK
jgi:hypothetical protein